jgi:hypothetical protein
MVRRGCPVLVLYGASVLGSVSVMGQQTATVNWDDIRGRIRAADATFQAVRSNLQAVTDPLTRQSLYPRARVESFIRANQEQVISALSPPVLRGARDHVAAYFDAALKMLKKASSATCPDCVTIDSTKEAYDYVSRHNAAVFSLDQIEVDLGGSSQPPKARLQLFYVDGTPYQETVTVNGLRIYRGKYDSLMTKAGYQDGKLQLDLIANPGTVLHCDLSLASAPAGSTCALKK